MRSPLIEGHGLCVWRDIRLTRRDDPGIVDYFVKRLERFGSRGGKFFWFLFLWRQPLDRHDDARGYLVAVGVNADLDHFKSAGEFVALGAIFHQFDGGDEIVRRVAFDSDLGI